MSPARGTTTDAAASASVHEKRMARDGFFPAPVCWLKFRDSPTEMDSRLRGNDGPKETTLLSFVRNQPDTSVTVRSAARA